MCTLSALRLKIQKRSRNNFLGTYRPFSLNPISLLLVLHPSARLAITPIPEAFGDAVASLEVQPYRLLQTLAGLEDATPWDDEAAGVVVADRRAPAGKKFSASAQLGGVEEDLLFVVEQEQSVRYALSNEGKP